MAWKIIAIIGLEKTVCIFMWNVTTFLSFLWLSALLFLVTVPGVCVFHTYRYFVSVIWVFCLFVYCSRRVTLPLSLSLALPLLLTVCDQSYKINCNWFCRFENWYACLIFTIKPNFFFFNGKPQNRYSLTIIRFSMPALNVLCMYATFGHLYCPKNKKVVVILKLYEHLQSKFEKSNRNTHWNWCDYFGFQGKRLKNLSIYQ